MSCGILQTDQVVAENRYDYRGFLSQRIEYENGQPM